MTGPEQATDQAASVSDSPRDYPALNDADRAIKTRFAEIEAEHDRLAARARSLRQQIPNHNDPSAARADLATTEARLAELEIQLAARDAELRALVAAYRDATDAEVAALWKARASAEARLVATSFRLERLLGIEWGAKQPTPSPRGPQPWGAVFQFAIAREPYVWDRVAEPADLIDQVATDKQHAEDRRIAELEEQRGRERARIRGLGG